jgi:hypothetical protein
MSYTVQETLAWAVIFALPAAGFAAGYFRARFSRAAIIAAVLTAASYAVLLVATGLWSASCENCTSGSDPFTRHQYFILALIWGGIFAGLIEASIWAGTLTSRFVGRATSH